MLFLLACVTGGYWLVEIKDADAVNNRYKSEMAKDGLYSLFSAFLRNELDYRQKHCWESALAVAFPRMRPYAGNYEYEPDPDLMLYDRHLVQLMAALRICFPKIGMSISTREPAPMRNALRHWGMTHMSAIARTEPGLSLIHI